MKQKTFIEHANDKDKILSGGNILSYISTANNLLSVINNANSSDPTKSEQYRSYFLALTDVLAVVGNFVGKPKIAKGLDIGTWISETGLVSHRLFTVNLPTYNEHRDFSTQKYKASVGWVLAPT